jgi:hypothetical protein
VTCSELSEAYAEPLLGTASTVRTWVLLEQAGAWPAAALASRQLAAGLGAALASHANQHRVRLVLIRRPGRSVSTQASRVFVAHVRETGSWLARTEVADPRDVTSLPFGDFAQGRSTGLEPMAASLFCVCTHGAHDQCCATRGRPVAAAMADRFPDETWEVSHIGGDRFAANVVCFPEGYYFGRVPAEGAAAVAAEYLAGRLALAYLRGRACYPTVVQAADVLVRTELGLSAMDAVRVVERSTTGDLTDVTFGIPGDRYATVRLRTSRAAEPRRLTCDVGQPSRPVEFSLVDVTTGRRRGA